MGLFTFAWIVGEGIIVWRWVKAGAPPTPGALLLPSAVYLALAVMAEYDPARATAIALAWGWDLAILLQVAGKAPKQVTGWPPLSISDPTVLLPGGSSSTGTSSGAVAPTLQNAGGTTLQLPAGGNTAQLA
jgi:hypothetical protein